ncbi:spore coat protein GerQ [Coprobacillaceae bacterium CR2/5/TPMF4]|nr:spore coat protein GerQ [Coprobacillaceae bacterium CR2/5/TPMF4]
MVPAPVIDQTYIENILRLNIGKLGTFYFTYSNSNEWRDKVYRGIIQQAGRDHFIIRDSKTNHEYLLQLVYFNWAEFDEPINYQHPYQ